MSNGYINNVKIHWRQIKNSNEILKAGGTPYNVGIGIADITGPAAEIVMMGYAKVSMISHGIHIRQYARTFIFDDPETSNR